MKCLSLTNYQSVASSDFRKDALRKMLRFNEKAVEPKRSSATFVIKRLLQLKTLSPTLITSSWHYLDPSGSVHRVRRLSQLICYKVTRSNSPLFVHLKQYQSTRAVRISAQTAAFLTIYAGDAYISEAERLQDGL